MRQSNRGQIIFRWLVGILLGLGGGGYIFLVGISETVLADGLWQSPVAPATTAPPAYLLWLLVGGAGMFGGFLFGIKDKRLVLPHRTAKYVIEPGFLGDCLFGLAGGFLVFILLPGNFSFELNSWEVVKIVAVAVVGGYGGRALVEKVLAQQFYELENDVRELRDQHRQGGVAIALIKQHLDDDLDTPLIPAEELKRAILGASASIKVQAFDIAQAFRNEHYIEHPELIERTIPIFEALIEDDEHDEFHRNHGELGYVYKDKLQPDWRRAEAELTRAIDIRDKQHAGGFLLYELNRAICHIHLGADLDEIKADLDKVLQRAPKGGAWVRNPDPKKGKTLLNWLRQHAEPLRGWLQENEISLPKLNEKD